MIPGVLGYHPAVDLDLRNPVGSRTGALLPTGRASEDISGVRASCVDVAVPMVIVAARDLGKSVDEAPAELDADSAFKARLRGRDGVLLTPSLLAASETVPKICIVSPARHGGAIAVRYFTPQQSHPSPAVSAAAAWPLLMRGHVPLPHASAQLKRYYRG